VTSTLALAVTGRGLVDPTEPVIRADDDALGRGRAVFETLRVYDGVPFRLQQHLERLGRSAGHVGISPPDVGELERLTGIALEAAAVPDAALRLYWTPGPPGGDPVGVALVAPLPDWIEPARARGQRLLSLLSPRRSAPWLLAGTKSTSYAAHMAAELEAKARGFDDALCVDAAGVVLEGPVTNIWWRVGHTLYTPSLELGILAGETRAALSELASGLRYDVVEGAFSLDAVLRDAEEAFTSSSVREVMPVVAIDERSLEQGAAAAELQTALRQVAGSSLV
jgi:branched-subunit amino acid aminotransferase/4-amino-4-deoxychorismate lyase